MLTNTERQQIVEEVNAGTYGIDEALDDIAAAQKGEEVRKALYAEALVLNREGHAGSTDMIARQQIANLQTSVNGQISTIRTEVGEDIDDLETALNSGLATQNGRIAAQNATIANVVANYNVEYGSTELWASTGETGALAAGTTVTLSEDVSHFDYIDIYSFCGNSNVLDTVPVDAKLQSNAGYALRWVNLSDPGPSTYEAYVRIVETKIKIIGTTLTIVHQVTYRNGQSVSVSGAEITQSNRSTYVGELGIMKIVGRKITANTEIEDVRIGADGTEYASAGQAVRAQVNDLKSAIPAIDDGLDTAGAAADAKTVGDALAEKADADDVTAIDARVTAVEGDIDETNERLGELYLTDNLQDAALWENGALNTGDGSTFQIDTRIVTKDWIPVSKGSTLAILNSYRFAYTVNSEPTVGTAYRLESKTLGQMVQTVTISHSGYIRVSIAPPSDTSVDVSIRSNLDANILSSRFDEVYENVENLTDEIEKTQNDVEATKSRINDVIKSSINLIDTDQNTKDYYINKNTGEVVTYVGWDASGYIPVKQTEYVAIFKGSNGWEYSPTIYMAFYDANKQYTHGMSVVPSAPYMQAVAGDAYARISYGRVANPDIMFGTMEDLEGYIGTSKDRVLAGNYIEDDLNYKKLESLPVRIIMPDKVVALVDEQFDIHYDNVLCYGNIKTIPYKEMFGSSFASMENMARAQVATAGKGNNSLHMYSSVPSSFMASQLPSIVLTKRFVYKTIEKNSGAGVTRNVLLIGDSTTAPGIYARELKALFEAETEPMNIRLLGTLGNGGAEVGAETGYHEGHGGYSCKTYCTTAYHNGYNNHFYNPTTQAFDFSYYMTYTGFTNIADVFIVMGINDVAAMEDYDEMMTYFRQMVTSIRLANSFDGQPARVFIALCIPPAEYEYSDMNNNSQRSKTRRLLLHERLIEEWGNRESEGFYIVPLNLSIDPEHDFKTEQRARSFRDQTMVTYCTDNVHPSAIAYNKMADRIRTYIKYAEI